MLTFRNMLIMILAGSMIIIAAGWIFGWLGNWLVLGLVSLNLGMIITGSFFVCSGLYIKVYCAASTNEKVLALTFDDGPRPEHTPAVLDLLAKYGIKAAFFVVGNNIKGNESILKRTSEDGHLIGNHSFVHANNFGFFGVSR
ncbi:MAG TPA: polysaccharide deacetylase family protein, partial [Bacteroidales bacterium]|nr:polysaccharide deacetylase family protein [Bacteroidales bacterium]